MELSLISGYNILPKTLFSFSLRKMHVSLSLFVLHQRETKLNACTCISFIEIREYDLDHSWVGFRI